MGDLFLEALLLHHLGRLTDTSSWLNSPQIYCSLFVFAVINLKNDLYRFLVRQGENT